MTQITDKGFVRTRLDERLQQLENSMRVIFGNDIDLAPDTIDGQTLGIMAECISNLDQLAEYAYQSFGPQTATGVALSRLVALNGLQRKQGTYSRVVLKIDGQSGTEIPINALAVSSLSNDIVFETIENCTIDISGTIYVNAQSVSIGEVFAPAETLTKIGSPTYGWNSVTNEKDALVGTEEETDAELRMRRARSTAAAAQGILDALYGRLKNLEDVINVNVYENYTNTTDTFGIPPHSIHVVIDGGTQEEIANTMWRYKSAGVGTYGTLTQSVLDSQGFSHTLSFSRPIEVEIYVEASIYTLVDFPEDGVAQMQNALVAWGNANQAIGQDVLLSQLYTPLNSVSGQAIMSLKIGTTSTDLNNDNITLSFDNIARFSVDNITITTIKKI